MGKGGPGVNAISALFLNCFDSEVLVRRSSDRHLKKKQAVALWRNYLWCSEEGA